MAVMAAALLHASWNALIKVNRDRFLSVSLLGVVMGLIAVAGTFFTTIPTGITWLWIAVSAVLHTFYKLFLIKAYEAGDFSQVYPLARGTAPLITATAALLLIGEALSAMMAAGIIVLCLGLAAMSLRGNRNAARISSTALFYAFSTSVLIAGYTLTDGIGGRSGDSVFSYICWMFVFDGFGIAAWYVYKRGWRSLLIPGKTWQTGFLTGALSITAYGLVIWAMTKAPVAAVASLRETSILFAVLIGAVFFREAITWWRLAAAVMIMAGVAAIRLG